MCIEIHFPDDAEIQIKGLNLTFVSFPRCTFAVDNADCKVNPDVERVLKEFHKAKKPIG